jgi:hypothetical protein
MPRYGVAHQELMAVRQPEVIGETLDVPHDALRLRTLGGVVPSPAKLQDGRRLVDGEAQAAEAPPETAIQIQKPEVQTRRYRYDYRVAHSHVPIIEGDCLDAVIPA